MKPVREKIIQKLRFQSIDTAHKAHPNSKSFDEIWIAKGRPVHVATWNVTLTPSFIISLIESQT